MSFQDFSKIETGEFKTVPNEFRLKNTIRKLKGIFGPMALQKKLFFDFLEGENVPEYVVQDEIRIC